MTIPDTSRARRAILERIRAAQGRSAEANATERATISGYIARHPRGPAPQPYADLLERFRAKAAEMASSVAIVEGWSVVPPAVARYLTAHALSPRAVMAATLVPLDWDGAGMQTEARAPVDEDLVGISRAFCAVAETGTLVFLSDADSPPTINLLPETHIAVLPASRIVATMEDAFDLIRSEKGELPRATNFISGPSRTGDIEQTIVLGAHGPRSVHIVVVRSA
jgi:L-lactate dehydrogenase complex protein LldG